MTDRKKEKEELMEKVFGKNAPNRSITAKDIEILSTTQIKIDSDLEKLRQQIIQDYPDEMKKADINISLDQTSLLDSFNKIEKTLNERIPAQKEYISGLCKSFKRPFISGQSSSTLNSVILVIGQLGTLRHQSIKEIVFLLKEHKIINNDCIVTIDINKYQSKEDENNFIMDLYSAICNSDNIVFDNIDQIAPSYLSMMEEIVTTGKLSLNKRYVLNNKQLTENNTSLVKNTVDKISFTNKNLIFLTTFKQSKLLTVLGNRFINAFTDIISTSIYDEGEIKELFINLFPSFKQKCLTKLNYQVSYDETFINNLADNYDGSNGNYTDKIFSDLYQGLSEYKLTHPSNEIIDVILSSKESKITFLDQFLDDYLSKQKEITIQEVKTELDEIVGLEEVKKYISSLQDFYQAQKLKQLAGLKTNEISKHMIFTGNPGTGKTTIARLLAKYLKAIGVLSNGQLIEVSRNDLVGKYVGHTAPLTMQVINSAIGGILFIDEAYSLYRGENDSFGLECIDTLVKAMEDNRDNLIVILAGYTREMKEFLQSNSGLQSRFPNQIEFPDYTGEELYKIALINAKSAGYSIDLDAKDGLINYFTKVQKDSSSRSGNGRLARNVVEKAIMNQSSRILKDHSDITVLKKEDFIL